MKSEERVKVFVFDMKKSTYVLIQALIIPGLLAVALVLFLALGHSTLWPLRYLWLLVVVAAFGEMMEMAVVLAEYTYTPDEGGDDGREAASDAPEDGP